MSSEINYGDIISDKRTRRLKNIYEKKGHVQFLEK